ncbi:polysaccharide biosynthesis C-terminal domain-containing protein [Sporolactobacillus terrae]|uniref:Uncharacterized protein n=1 Tax=Sporolactobacillus terrae TaxID=269673 RepID=A0A5K7WT43_9BACL|nr:polysaccharide biosynthesis C-terminal domain-containing protein [Sporolactobacillus terrae]BBN97851.1 hypothetical protein St703_05560 [Sporolactobacillus terrae]
MTNRYKKLALNSIIFAIGNLGSKVIALALIPLYTFYLSKQAYGTVDLMTTTISLLLPIFAMSIYDAVLRFVMDKSYDKSTVLNNGLALTLIGAFVALALFPLFMKIFPFANYMIYFYLLLLTKSINTVLLQYIRADGKVKLFASVGIISALVILVGNTVSLVVLNLGLPGYLVSLIIAEVVSLLIMITLGNIIKQISIFKIKMIVLKEMLVYSIPLIPNTLMWWVMGVSDRYIITYFVGISANGLYALANKIPNILSVVNSIFFQAWQMSAIEEADSKSKSEFYSKIFSILATAMFICASIILLFLKLIMHLVVAHEYFESWEYVPFLLLAVIFSSFSGFLGTNYIAAKNTVGVFRTSIIGAVINVSLNFALIPIIGVNGASISTMISFLAIWLIRIYETKKFVQIKINTKQLIPNLLLIFLQIIIIYMNIPIEFLIQLPVFIAMLLVNKREIKLLFSRAFTSIKRKMQRNS